MVENARLLGDESAANVGTRGEDVRQDGPADPASGPEGDLDPPRSNETTVSRRRVRGLTRAFWTAAGSVALVFGGLGVVLPVLPTTPFVILAAFAFGKSSPRLRQRLEAHPTFGPAIRDWEAHGAIARRHKTVACLFMALAFGASAVAGLRPAILAVQALCMGGAALFVLTRPDRSRAG